MNLQDRNVWLRHRRAALRPTHVSETRSTVTDRAEFLHGATLLRLYGPTGRAGYEPKPQQLLVCDVLAAGSKLNGILLPRRSSKSTSLIAVGLGRAAAREDYRVGILTMTSGKAGRSRFLKDVAPAIERVLTSEYGSDRKAWPLKIIRSSGQEHIEFKESGGIVAWLSSIDDLRGEAFDLIILDEAGEAEPEKVAEVLSAALPTLDTRPGGQIVAAGTAGRYRAGNLLWDWLELGREGLAAILEYSIPDDTPEEAFEDWDTTEPLVRASHPGIDTLTTIESIEGNYRASSPDDFAREYGGIFGRLGEGRGALSAKEWAASGEDIAPTPPMDFTIAMAASFDQRAGSIVAAWRDEKGRACGYVLEHRRGTTWISEAAATLARRHRSPILYDVASATIRAEVEVMNRMTPRPYLESQRTADITTAAALLTKEVAEGRVRHWRQPALDEAARIAIRRSVGPSAWAFGRPGRDQSIDLSALEAFAMALRWYDDNPQRAMIAPIVAA